MIDKIKVAMKAKGYAFFENGDYNLNIIGIRTIGNKVTNVFDDLLTLSYKVNGEWVFKQWAATTDPGTKGVKEFHNAQGVARLVPGQYKGQLLLDAVASRALSDLRAMGYLIETGEKVRGSRGAFNIIYEINPNPPIDPIKAGFKEVRTLYRQAKRERQKGRQT